MLSGLVRRVVTREEQNAFDEFLDRVASSCRVAATHLDSATLLRLGADALNALADYVEPDPAGTAYLAGDVGQDDAGAPPIMAAFSAVIPAPTVSISAHVSIGAAVTARVSIPTPTVEVIPNSPTLSKKQQRLALQVVVFIAVWLSLTSMGLEQFQQADVLITSSGLTPWAAAVSAMWLVGQAFDLLYPSSGDDDR